MNELNEESAFSKIGRKAKVKKEYFTAGRTLLKDEIVIIRGRQKSAITHDWELLVSRENSTGGQIITIPEGYLELIEEESKSVDSTSDERITNNVMRHNYRVLSDDEKEQMKEAKDRGLEFVEFLDTVGNSRELSLAKTKMEEAVMWAVKHITG